MNVWSIKDTENHILRVYGKEQLWIAKPSLHSIYLRGNYAHYHYQESNKLLDKFLRKELKTKAPFEVSFENSNSKELTLIKVEANILACLSNIHTVADIFSHAIYYSFGLNLTNSPIHEDKISTNSVLKLIKHNNDFDLIAELLSTLKNGGNFEHLSAIVNSTKHRAIKRLNLSFDLNSPPNKSYSMKIPAYHYKEKGFPEVEVKAFLTKEYNRIFKLHIDIGNAINEVLIAKQH
ncbi:MAG: hypothetical protein V4552_09890 [Pseudomonadota bacterium]